MREWKSVPIAPTTEMVAAGDRAEFVATTHRTSALVYRAMLDAAPPSGASEDVQRFAIEVEKLLCSKLGRSWSPVGISIESLINELAERRLENVQRGAVGVG